MRLPFRHTGKGVQADFRRRHRWRQAAEFAEFSDRGCGIGGEYPNATGAEFRLCAGVLGENLAYVTGLIGKFLFPKATRSQRKRRLRAIFFWLIASVAIVAAVAGFIYMAYVRGLH